MKQLDFIDLRTDTDGGGISRHVTAQEFLQAEPRRWVRGPENTLEYKK